ncbi:LiaF transmembrane domain-containing protein [Halalkalibacter hemicellulosilyticus]|uniref:LiaF transmembrane domain-containing protein n=1 Tax=Halalkalibacter hemicellulosilyticusJCM 9152 TaxID=1236971 RepID=W4QGB8_9BACI|nr:hypothetical protein [Halalkalibacter hemicellulosilyticus]GAE30379.1 hypothetical protein JCM9152_1785 [Halalkalibacter hemicellulosilyticusJCM 9152]
MKLTGKVFAGFLLIFIGASMLLSLIGIHLGGLLGLAIGAALLYWGYCRYQENGRWSLSSIILIVLGISFLFGGIGGVISLLIGGFLVYVGYQFMTKSDTKKSHEEEEESLDYSKSTYDSLDEEIDRLLEKK